jgi:hypothetical protein
MLKKLGLFSKDSIIFPGDESTPRPPINFRVTFVDFLFRGLSVPLHEFLRGLIIFPGDESIYQNDSCNDHWTTVSISLSALEEPRI